MNWVVADVSVAGFSNWRRQLGMIIYNKWKGIRVGELFSSSWRSMAAKSAWQPTVKWSWNEVVVDVAAERRTKVGPCPSNPC